MLALNEIYPVNQCLERTSRTRVGLAVGAAGTGGRTYNGVCAPRQAAQRTLAQRCLWRVFTGRLVDVDALETAPNSQQFLKSRRLEGVDIHLSRKPKSGRSQKTRRAQVCTADRMGDAGGRLCDASVLCARHVIHGCEDHGCGFQCAVGAGAACILARCQDRASMRCGLAARPILRRQVRQVSSAIF